jgi:ATP-binding protein involved in chromosome partitioning
VQSIRESGDSGLPVVLKDGPTSTAFMELAAALAQQVAIRNAKFESTKRVEINT